MIVQTKRVTIIGTTPLKCPLKGYFAGEGKNRRKNKGAACAKCYQPVSFEEISSSDNDKILFSQASILFENLAAIPMRFVSSGARFNNEKRFCRYFFVEFP